MVKENLLCGTGLNEAVEKALDNAVSKKLLDGYFEKHRARIKTMSLTEYDEEEAKKVFHDDGYKEGIKEGIVTGAAEQKAKDDLIIQEKDNAISEKDAEIKSQSEEIARLKAQLAAKCE